MADPIEREAIAPAWDSGESRVRWDDRIGCACRWHREDMRALTVCEMHQRLHAQNVELAQRVRELEKGAGHE